MTTSRDPRIAPERGDYLEVNQRRHVRVESVTQTDGGVRVRMVVRAMDAKTARGTGGNGADTPLTTTAQGGDHG